MSLLVRESFDYTAGVTAASGTLDGGSGWSGAWGAADATSYKFLVDSGEITYTNYPYTGKQMQMWAEGNSTTYEYLYRSISGEGPTTGVIWLSYVLGVYDSKTAFHMCLRGLITTATGTIGTNDVNLLSSSSDSQPTPVTARSGTVLFTGTSGRTGHLIVIRLGGGSGSGGGTSSTLTYYKDPDLTADQSTWSADATNSGCHWVTGLHQVFYSGLRAGSTSYESNWWFSEFRMADTWQDAVGASTGPTNYGNMFPFFWNQG